MMQGPASFSVNIPQIYGNTQDWIVGDATVATPITPAWAIPANPVVGSIFRVDEYGQFGWGTAQESLQFWPYLGGVQLNNVVQLPSGTFADNADGGFRYSMILGVNSLGISGTCTVYCELAIGAPEAVGAIFSVCQSNAFAMNTTVSNTFQGQALWAVAEAQSLIGLLGSFTLTQTILL